MGKRVITHSGSTHAFKGPAETPVHRVRGKALISFARAGQAGKDAARRVPALPAPAPLRASPRVPEWIRAHTSSPKWGPTAQLPAARRGRDPSPSRDRSAGPLCRAPRAGPRAQKPSCRHLPDLLLQLQPLLLPPRPVLVLRERSGFQQSRKSG